MLDIIPYPNHTTILVESVRGVLRDDSGNLLSIARVTAPSGGYSIGDMLAYQKHTIPSEWILGSNSAYRDGQFFIEKDWVKNRITG